MASGTRTMTKHRHQGRASVGHPVDVASGVEYTAAHDVEIPGLIPLYFRRAYSSHVDRSAPHASTGALGPHWFHRYEMSLVIEARAFVFWGHDGSPAEFTRAPGPLPPAAPLQNPSQSMELRWESDRYVVYHWHEWFEPVKKFVFEPPGTRNVLLLSEIALLSGPSLILERDRQRRLERVRQSVERRALAFRYDTRGRLIQLLREAPGSAATAVVEYAYDRHGFLAAVRDPGGAATRYAYDAHGRLLEEVGPGGLRFQMSYDAQGRCIETTGIQGYKRRTLQYDDLLGETRVQDSLGNVTTYRWNEHGQILELEDPTGAVERTTYDDEGRIIAVTGPSGEKLLRSYDAHGHLVATERPGGNRTTFEFDADHQVTAITRADGGRWQLQYHAGALVEVLDPCGGKTLVRYDANGVPIAYVTAAGNHIVVDFDPAWTRVSYRDKYGLLSAFALDEALRITAAYDHDGLVRRFFYDTRGFIRRTEEANGFFTDVSCSATGKLLTMVDAHGERTSLVYDAYEQFTAVRYPDGATFRYTWNSEGNVVDIQDPYGRKATYAYDPRGLITSFSSWDGRIERFDYDASSRRVRRHKPDGVVLAFSFDMAGNLLSCATSDGVLATNEYDVLDRLVRTVTPGGTLELAYDACDRRIAEVQDGFRVALEYHPFGCLAQRTLDGSTRGPLQFRYDERLRLCSVERDGSVLLAYRHDGANRLQERTLGQAREFLRWSGPRIVSQTVLDASGAPAVEREFSYDARRRPVSIRDSVLGFSHYRYGASGRLELATAQPGATSDPVEYDAAGNLVRFGSHHYVYRGSDGRLIRDDHGSFTYDACGRLTEFSDPRGTFHLSWNAFDQLVQIVGPGGSTTHYGYDGLGRRTYKEHDDVTTQYHWAGNDLTCEIASEKSIEYFIGRNILQLVFDEDTPFYVTTSAILRPHELLDSAGRVTWRGSFDPWGAPLTPTPSVPLFGAAGQYYDPESGLYYNRFRYYSPRGGRFISPDPVGLAPSLNEYLLGPELLNWADPWGLTCGQVHFQVTINPNIQGRGGAAPPTQADWIAKRDSFNQGVQNGINNGTPLTIPTPAQYAADRRVGNAEARQARQAQGMGPDVQADHPVDLCAGGGQGQALQPLASGVNGSVGSQVGNQAGALAPGSPTPMIDLYDQNGNLIP